MTTRQEARSEETKRAILTEAGRLFSERGYNTVTMREIAKAAGCSHTTIYIYFKDKEALLHQLSVGPLNSLKAQMESAVQNAARSAPERLRDLTRCFIRFCLSHRNMYTIFFMTEAARVDDEAPVLEVNRLRNEMFGMLRKAIRFCLQEDQVSDELVLAYARIYFFMLHGIIATYTNSEEPLEALMGRLEHTFDLGVDVFLSGFQQRVR